MRLVLPAFLLLALAPRAVADDPLVPTTIPGLMPAPWQVIDTRLQSWPAHTVRLRPQGGQLRLLLAPQPAAGALAFEDLYAIQFAALEPSRSGSRPGVLELLDMGAADNDLPPPPDWQRTIGQGAPWVPGEAVDEPRGLAFLPGAIACWMPRQAAPAGNNEGPRQILMRQAIEIEAEASGRALLHISASATLRGGALNEVPLVVPTDNDAELLTYDVSPVLHAGSNILALRLFERPGGPNRHEAVAFVLECTPTPRGAGAPKGSADAGPVRVRIQEREVAGVTGGNFTGSLLGCPAGELEIATAHGPWRVPVSGCASVLLQAVAAETMLGRLGLAEAWTKDPAADTASGPAELAPLWPSPAMQGRALLRHNELRALALEGSSNDQLLLRDAQEQTVRLPAREVLAWYPPTVPGAQPEPDNLRTRVHLRNGDVMLGELAQLNARQIRLSQSGSELGIPLTAVARVEFPAHGPLLNRLAGTPGSILCAPVLENGAAESRIGRIAAQWNEGARHAAAAIGASLTQATPEAMLQLDPARTRIVLVLNPGGRYLRTVAAAGDAEQALLDYVEQGGHVLVISHGGALRRPWQASGDGLAPEETKRDESASGTDQTGDGEASAPALPQQQETLADRLALRRLQPSDAAQPLGRAFLYPPNAEQPPAFVLETRRAEFAASLIGLPSRCQMTITPRPQYQPVLPDPRAQADIFYTLRSGDDAEDVLGPGLTLIRRGRGVLMLVDHLLWSAQTDAGPFTETILPQLLRWSLEVAPR